MKNLSFGFVALTLVACAAETQPTEPTELGASTKAIVIGTAQKDWRQVTASFNMSWDQIAALCPTDGVTSCQGSLAGWTWATDAQLLEMMASVQPALLTTRFVSQPFGPTLVNTFQPTFVRTNNCTYCNDPGFASVSGFTATKDPSGVPYVGLSDSNGGMGVVATWGATGAWLFQNTGPGAVANDDVGSVASPSGGNAVVNVLSNDWVNGARATLANVTLSAVSSSHTGLTLDVLNGAVNVFNAPAGTQTLTYKICSIAAPISCDTANAIVTVKPYVIDAVNDSGRASSEAGGPAVASVLTNDRVGFAQATPSSVVMSTVSAPAGISLDSVDGSVDVAVGTPNGTYELTYKICERVNPTNCDQAVATVLVAPSIIDAVDDSVRASSRTGGTVITSVLANDTVTGAPATGRVFISLVTQPAPGISLDLTTGAVKVLPKTSSGITSFVYKICETASPLNCDTATVTLELSGKGGT
jgi:hypothetical protein